MLVMSVQKHTPLLAKHIYKINYAHLTVDAHILPTTQRNVSQSTVLIPGSLGILTTHLKLASANKLETWECGSTYVNWDSKGCNHSSFAYAFKPFCLSVYVIKLEIPQCSRK